MIRPLRALCVPSATLAAALLAGCGASPAPTISAPLRSTPSITTPTSATAPSGAPTSNPASSDPAASAANDLGAIDNQIGAGDPDAQSAQGGLATTEGDPSQ